VPLIAPLIVSCDADTSLNETTSEVTVASESE
jgi:hypothetical protein